MDAIYIESYQKVIFSNADFHHGCQALAVLANWTSDAMRKSTEISITVRLKKPLIVILMAPTQLVVLASTVFEYYG